jgi:hypothetical protein
MELLRRGAVAPGVKLILGANKDEGTSFISYNKLAEEAHPPECAMPQPGATLSVHTAIDCHWRSFLRDLHSDPDAIAVIFCRNDSVALG